MNNSNATSNAYHDLHSTLLMSMWTVGLLLDVFNIVIITLSKPKLIPLEFYILMTLSISLVEFKIIIDTNIILNFISEKYHQYCTFTILNLGILSSGCFNMLTLFYYSLFQASNVSRIKLFVMVHELVHKKKTFIIYQICNGFLSIFLSALYFFLAYLDVNQCPKVYFLMNKFIFNGSLITQLVFASFLPIFVYISTAVYIYFFSNRGLISKDNMQRARFRKNLIVMLKFLTLATFFALGIWLLNICYCVSFLFPGSIAYIITGYLSFFFFSLMNSSLIFIHSITKKTLKSYVFCIFK